MFKPCLVLHRDTDLSGLEPPIEAPLHPYENLSPHRLQPFPKLFQVPLSDLSSLQLFVWRDFRHLQQQLGSDRVHGKLHRNSLGVNVWPYKDLKDQKNLGVI